MDEFIFSLTCPLCGTKTTVTVHDVDETPGFCPMCGMETEYSDPDEEW
jgi:rubrerythrin